MTGNDLNYFAGGNTAKGFFSYFASNLADLERLFILKGGPGTGKSYLIRKIGAAWKAKGYSFEYMYCSSDKDSVDGIIIRELKVGIVDGTKPHVIEPKFPGVVDDYVHLGVACHAEKLNRYKEQIILLTKQVGVAFRAAYHSFGKAYTFHEKAQLLTGERLKRDEVQKITARLVQDIFQQRKTYTSAIVKQRFHGALTPTGPFSFIEQLIAPLQRRYFINGRFNIGTSILLKRLLLEAEVRGFDTEVYYCGFDPEHIDLIIIRELDVAIFDNHPPHEVQPNRKNDVVLDMDRTLSSQLNGDDETELQSLCNEKIKAGLVSLERAKALRDQLESYYIEAMDFDVATEIRHDLQREIEKIEKGQ